MKNEMTIRSTDQEFFLMRDLIQEHCGIFLTGNKKYLIENRLSKLVKKSGCQTFGEFYLKLKSASSASPLRNSVIDEITTNETLWLRDQHPFTFLEEHVFPEFLEDLKTGTRRCLNIWSAACSTGQEPYSIAITAYDFYIRHGINVSENSAVRILGTDISSAALSIAEEGKYDTYAVNRGMPPKFLKAYFQKEENEWRIREEIRRMVTFRMVNLKEPFIGLFGPFDIVFLRNAIIYFSDEFKKELFYRVSRMLLPDGYFFLGTGETVSGYTELFHILDYKGATYYRLKKR